jgi:hypothetical protein
MGFMHQVIIIREKSRVLNFFTKMMEAYLLEIIKIVNKKKKILRVPMNKLRINFVKDVS